MATISDLNVRLGLISKGFEQDLRKLERTLAASGRRLSSLGTELTFAVSAPLAALGASAIQQTGNLESLKLAMKSTFETAGRSAADANKEVEALRKSALAPGLDFEQAIKGSIRLQGVGYAAEAARATLEQVANAIALTGGTAENLDSVTVQMSQMIAKGKVLSQDLRIIQENMPIISRLMQQAFGTQNAEALQAMGISGREFVDRITAAAATLPRVEGGIKNALVNAGAAARQALAQLGEEINKTFNVSGALDSFVKTINNLVNAFASLSPETKKTLLSMAGIAFAAGPVVKVFGVLTNITGSLVSTFKGVVSGLVFLKQSFSTIAVAGSTAVNVAGAFAANLKLAAPAAAQSATAILALKNNIASTASVAAAVKNVDFAKTVLSPISGTAAKATTAVAGLTGAMRTMALVKNIAFAAGAVGIIAGAIYAAVTVFQAYNREAEKAERVQRSLDDVTQAAAASIADQKTKVTLLAEALKDENTSRAQKKKALAELQQIAPKEFANLDIERIKVGEVDAALNNYIATLTRAAKVKAAYDRLGQIGIERANLANAGETSTLQKISSFLLSAGNNAAYAGTQATMYAQNVSDLSDQLNTEEKALLDLIKTNGDYVSAANSGSSASKTFSEGAADAAQKSKLYADALKSINAVVQKGDVLGADIIGEQAKEIENQIERLIENGFKPYGKEVQNLRNMLQGLQANQQIKFDAPAQLPGVALPNQVLSIDTSPAQQAINALTAATEKAAGANGKLKSSFQEIADILISSQEGINGFSNSLQQAFDFASERGQVLNSVMLSVSNSLFDAAASGAQSFGDLAQAAVASAAKVVRAWIQQGVAAAVSKALGGLPFPANLVAGASAGAIAGTLFTRALAALKVPALASGGIATSPTLAMVGEYPGAASNPEIIAPESKLRQIFRQEQGAGGGQLTAVLRGDDILFMLDKAVARRGRRK